MLGPRERQRAARTLDRWGLGRPARWLWAQRPAAAAQRRFVAGLARADRLDNQRLRLVLASALAPDANCIDIGAATGAMLEDILRVCPAGRHIAYEPIPADCAVVAERFPTVDVRNAAVSEAAGETTFAYLTNAAGWSGIRAAHVQVQGAEVEEITVRTVRLDDDLPSDYAPDFIKIDVNGAERQVLEGAMATLRRHRPVVFIEHGRAAATYGTTPRMIHELLVDEAGLRLFDLEGNGPLDAEGFAAAVQSKWNFLARP